MTSERPFRPRLSREEALAEIEANAGTQFHPVIAKAFVAVQRGERPDDVLSKEELSEIRNASVPAPSRGGSGGVALHPELLIAVGVAAALVGVGMEVPEVAVGGAVVALAGLTLRAASRFRAGRLRRRLDEALAVEADERRVVFDGIVDVFHRAWPLQFAQLVCWHEDGAGGTVSLRRGAWDAPDPELMSWLLREAESDRDLILDEGQELDSEATTIALPLRLENSALVGFLVLGGKRRPPTHVLGTARSVLDRLGLALGDAPEAEAAPAALVKPTPRETVVFREGQDLSVLVVGPLLDTALEAIERVRPDVSVELLLLPADGAWDSETVLSSVAKTSKVVLMHEKSGDELRVAEVAAYIAEDAFHHLDAPVRRVQLPGADLVEQLEDLAEI
jgi:hypothetical protein